MRYNGDRYDKAILYINGEIYTDPSCHMSALYQWGLKHLDYVKAHGYSGVENECDDFWLDANMERVYRKLYLEYALAIIYQKCLIIYPRPDLRNKTVRDLYAYGKKRGLYVGILDAITNEVHLI